MVEQVTLQTIGILLTGISLTVAATYYTLTLRNSQKARKTATLMQLYQSRQDPESVHRFWRIMGLTWENYEDYLQRWGPYANPEGTEEIVLITSSWNFLDGLGKMLREGLVDIDTVYDMFGHRILMVWFKFETIIQAIRIEERGGAGSDYLLNFEYLADEMIRLKKERGQELPLFFLHPTSTLHQELKT